MNDRTFGPVLINGVPHDPADAAISIFDIGFQRGYGCFEAMRVYRGTPFRLDDHLDRLGGSAKHLRIELPAPSELRAWCSTVAAQAEPAGGGVLRVLVTGGIDQKHPGTDSQVIVFVEPLPTVPAAVRLDVLDAPWHADGRSSELTGAKTLSYGPNLAATITARTRGFDDAALVGAGDVVLEGPTFSLGWAADGQMCTPALDSHILASITREATIEVANMRGILVREERFLRADLLAADEVFVMSTVREVLPAVAVGDRVLEPGPITATLRDGFHELVASETG